MSEARYQDQEQGKDVHSHTVFQQLLVLEVLGILEIPRQIGAVCQKTGTRPNTVYFLL